MDQQFLCAVLVGSCPAELSREKGQSPGREPRWPSWVWGDVEKALRRTRGEEGRIGRRFLRAQ